MRRRSNGRDARAGSSFEVDIAPIDVPAPRDPTGDLADRLALDAALEQLSPTHRAVVVLHYYLGLTLPEVAAALDIPTGTAKSRLNRSLAAMRASIAADGIPDAALVAGGQLA